MGFWKRLLWTDHRLMEAWEHGAKQDLLKDIEEYKDDRSKTPDEVRGILRGFLQNTENRILYHATVEPVKKPQKVVKKSATVETREQ